MQFSSKSHLLGGAVVTTAIVLAGMVVATPASAVSSAADVPLSSTDAAALVERVAPDQGVVSTRSGLSTDPAAPVVVHGTEGAQLSVTLPTSLGLATGTQTQGGSLVFPSQTSRSSAVAQKLDTGAVRVQTITSSAAALTPFSYSFGSAFQPVQAPDGTFWIEGFGASGRFEAYSVAPAWARDANGVSVSTHYEIQGSNLVQIVTPAAHTAYPIVADPTWQWYNFAYGAGFSKTETKHLASYTVATGFCAGFGKWKPLLAVCGIAAADWFLQAQMATNAKGCVFIAAVPAPLAVRWNSKDCQ